MNGRIYDPLVGRFLSADLVVQFPGSLQSYNRYSYVGNNPLSRTDKNGYQEAVISPEEAEKLKNSAAKLNELVQSAINKAFDRLEKGKIKPEQVVGEVHATLAKGENVGHNDLGVSKALQRQGKDYVSGESTKGTKYDGGIPLGKRPMAEAEKEAGAAGEKVAEAAVKLFFSHKNKDGVVVWNDDKAISPGINLNGSAIGTDKVDHMFQVGFELFGDGLNDEQARTASAEMENGGRGMLTTGVYSNADIEANMNGLSFYKELDAAASSGTRMQFDIGNYNIPGMDENVNPNVYTTDLQAIVDRNTKKE